MNKDRQKVVEFEAKVLQFSGLELNKELFVYDVEIELNGRKHFIHTYECGNENKDALVLLHGYAGSSALYYKMLKTLAEKFHVFCIDIIGMGLSSRESFECQSTEETIEFLTSSIEEWRKAVGLERFNLGGHSFGAYTSMHYTLRYENRVKKLSLLSPVGFSKRRDPTPEEIAEREEGMGFWQRTVSRWISGFAKKAVEEKLTPHKFIKDHCLIGRYIVKKYTFSRFNLPENEAEAMYDYLYAMLRLPEGSEKAIHYIVKATNGLAPHLPLEDIIEEIKAPVDCYYGDNDYMDSSGAQRIYYSSMKKRNFKIKYVPEAQHQVTIQNPLNLANQIVVSALA